MGLLAVSILLCVFLTQFSSWAAEEPSEKQLLSLVSIRKFLSSIDRNVVNRIRDIVKFPNLLKRVQKLLQKKTREGFNERMIESVTQNPNSTSYHFSLVPTWLRSIIKR